MRFWFILGTAAELIKTYPLVEYCERHGHSWHVLSTGQSGVNLQLQYQDFALPAHKIISLASSNSDLKNSFEALKWMLKALFVSSSKIKQTVARFAEAVPQPGDYCFIHGDTLSTLVGAIYARRLALKIVHVEAGMRSGSIFSPFPEEITRRIVTRFAGFHMCPDEQAAQNVRDSGVLHGVFNTQANTVVDALHLTIANVPVCPLPATPYIVANVHRHENLADLKKLEFIIETLIEARRRWYPVYLVLMPNTKEKLARHPELKSRLENAGIGMMDRLPFGQFLHWMNRAEFVLSDGGSNQQECYFLGKPCLVLRDRTEGREGIGANCVLSKLDRSLVNAFLENPMRLASSPVKPEQRPTERVFQFLNLKSGE